jgi:catechol-2,3-dioxygenase
VANIDPADEHPVFHHVNLKTTRLKQMIDWYGKAVGARPNFEFAGGAFLTNDKANHRIALITTPNLIDDPDKVRHAGIHHVAFEFASLSALLRNYERLRECGIRPHMSLDHGITTSFYYLDPDGNSVELQSDNFGNWEKSSDWIRNSQQFAENPIGVPVDPEQMLAAQKEGGSDAEIQKRANAGQFPPAEPPDYRIPF